MRIGEFARRVGVTTDTVRFYERSGWLPNPVRQSNTYREYSNNDLEHLRLQIDLRRLEIPLEDAARIASWCHTGHCRETSARLPEQIAGRRADIADRIAGPQALGARLQDLQSHLASTRWELNVLFDGTPCCAAAEAVVGAVEGGCACCNAGTGELARGPDA